MLAHLELAAGDPLQIDIRRAADWVGERVDVAEGSTAVLFHTIVWQYLLPEDRDALRAHLAEVAATQVGALIACFEHEERAQRLYGETLASLSNALEAKDASTGRHTEEVVRLAVAVATELELRRRFPEQALHR